MKNTTYNGWTNIDTWRVNVEFNPESKDDIYFIKDHLESIKSSISEDENLRVIHGFIDLSQINWNELLSHFEEED